MRSSARRATTVLAAAALTLSACSVVKDDAPESSAPSSAVPSQPEGSSGAPQPQQPDGQSNAPSAPVDTSSPSPLPVVATGASNNSTDVKLDINKLRRDSNGTVTLIWTMTNNSDERVYPGIDYTGNGVYFPGGVSGVSLVNKKEKVRYRSLRDPKTGHCICSILGAVGTYSNLDKGDSGTFYNMYKFPSDVQKVTVEVPHFTSIKDVAIK